MRRASFSRAVATAAASALYAGAVALQGPVGPPVAPPPTPGGPAAPAPPAGAPQQPPQSRSYRDQTNPYLQYATNVKVRVSQLELGAFPTVRAFVSVMDEQGTQIRTLKEGDFTVTENKVQATDVHFANRDELNLPLAIMFVVDISGSMEAALPLEVEAVKQFVGQLKPRDRVGLITFSDAPVRQAALTTTHEDVLSQLDQLAAWGQTTLYDAIRLGEEELLADPDPARRALIVLSDGMDNKSIETPQTVLQYYDDEALKKNRGFSVYTLGLGEEVDRSGLGQIATRTGGLYVDSPTAEDLTRVYQDILSQIQNEYLLEYTSPAESKPGQIIDVSVGITPARSFTPGTYTYRSPGLTMALARVLWPGLITISVLLVLLILATIYKLSRRVWLTLMITPLEGKDYVIGMDGVDIGAIESCQVRPARDPAILPLHATLRETSDGYLIEAVDPEAPIICGERILKRKLLRHGDRFTLGTTRFVFHERVLRPGEGREEDAEHFIAAPPPPLTEEAQRAGTGAAVQAARTVPHAMVAISGPCSGQRFALREGSNAVGRSEGSILFGADNQVSRRHCDIALKPTQATVTDLGSTNGTRLNGAPCQPGLAVPACSGDVLAIGSGEYRLE